MELRVINQDPRTRAVHQKMELPHDKEGKLDWKTLGNLLTANILGEVLHAKYVDYKYGRVSKDTRVDTSWQFSFEEAEVIVLKKTYSDSPLHAFMGRGVIELPLKEVYKFIRNVHHRKQWDRHLVNIEVLREISGSQFIIHSHYRANKCLVKVYRDFMYYEKACKDGDKYVMTAMSVELPEFPNEPGIKRAQLLPGSGWVLEPYEGSPTKTLASYMAHLDLVSLPPIIINRVLRRQVMAVHYIRNILTPLSPSLTTFTPVTDTHSPPSRRLPWTSRGRRREEGGKEKEGERDLVIKSQLAAHEGGGEGRRGCNVGCECALSGAHFEDPVSVEVFTQLRDNALQIDSVPWDPDHNWAGRNHTHTHNKVGDSDGEFANETSSPSHSTSSRMRSSSNGAQPKFYALPHQLVPTVLTTSPAHPSSGEQCACSSGESPSPNQLEEREEGEKEEGEEEGEGGRAAI